VTPRGPNGRELEVDVLLHKARKFYKPIKVLRNKRITACRHNAFKHQNPDTQKQCCSKDFGEGQSTGVCPSFTITQLGKRLT
jgi:hypothetical protein